MKRQLWFLTVLLALGIISVHAQTELTQEELKKMVENSAVILEGNIEKAEGDFYTIQVSEIFQGMQRVKSLTLYLPAQEARVYLFSLDPKYQIKGQIGEDLRREFKKYGQSLDAGELRLETKKKDQEWWLENTIKLESATEVEYLTKKYMIVRKDYLDVYMPLQEDTAYIFFLQREGDKFVLAPFVRSMLKSNIFLPGRVREAAMKWRLDRSDIVAAATATTTTEEGEEKISVTATCKSLRMYKGTLPEQFEIKYERVRQTFPPMVILFDNFNYVFFLKSPAAGESGYRLINPYEGAYPEDRYLLKDLENQAKNRFDEIAGQPLNGLRNYARMQKTEIKNGEPVIVELMLLNVSEAPLEIYHNQIAYFTLFHILDETGNVVAAKYPRVISIPTIHKRYFIKLDPGGYIVAPPFNLQDYCNFKPGNYTIYVEFDLPWEYSGKTIGKTAWSGKTMSNKLEFTVSE